jgi:hypothetical protein
LTILLKIVSSFFILLFVLGVALQLITWRKQRAVRPWTILLGQAAAFVSMVAFSVLTARPPGPVAWVLLLGTGLLAGLVYGGFVRVVRSRAGIMMGYTVPWILTWAVLMTLTQLFAVFARQVPTVLYGFAVINLGLNIGMNARVLRAYRAAAVAAASALLLGLLPGLLPGAGADTVVSRRAVSAGIGSLSWEAPALSDVPPELAPALVLLDGRPGWEQPARMMFPGSSPPAPSPAARGSYRRDRPGRGSVSLDYSFTRTARRAVARGDGTNPYEGSWSVSITWYEDPAEALASLESKTEQNARLYRTERVRAGDLAVVKHSTYPSGAPSDQVLVRVGSAYVHWQASVAGYFDGGNVFDVPGGEQLTALIEALPRLDVTRVLDARLGSAGGDAAAGGSDAGPGASGSEGQPTRARDRRSERSGEGRAGPGDRRRAGAADARTGREGSPGTRERGDNRGPGVPSEGEPPLDPARAAAAVAFSSLALAGGSLLQLLPTMLRTTPIGSAPTGVAASPPLANPDEERARQLEAEGYRWSTRDGWVTDDQARENEAQRDRAWQAHLQQDPEVARIQERIREAREAQAAARAAQAQADRKIELMDRQRELAREVKSDLAEVARWEWVGLATDAVQLAADIAIGEIAEVTGPVGQAIRAGYDTAKGVATSVGEAMAQGRDLTAADLRRGIWYGLENVAADMGVDAAGRKLTGSPGLFEDAAGAASPAVREAVDKAAALADPRLAAKAAAMKDALARNDPSAILRLYGEAGMKDLAALERLGHIGPEEARRLNAALSGAVDRAVDRGTRESMDLWEKGNPGVRLKEVLIGDSGSSAVRARPRSVLTDFDRTTVPVFDPDDVAAHAGRRGISPAEAHRELTVQFKSIHEKSVGDFLPEGLSRKDVDYKSYGGFGSKAGQSDAYPSGFATTRQATQGRTTVYPPGGARPHAASGEAAVDQWRLETARHGADAPLDMAPRIAPQEFPAIANEQVKAILEKSDPKSVAKAVDRLAYMAQRSEVSVTGFALDEDLVRLVAQVKKNPQDVARVLERAGVSMEDFARRALDEAHRLQQEVRGWDRVGGGV